MEEKRHLVGLSCRPEEGTSDAPLSGQKKGTSGGRLNWEPPDIGDDMLVMISIEHK